MQDFYPTPGTASTVMYYTGINPLSGKKVYCPTDYHEKQLQRALLQSGNPKNADLVREALEKCGRTDLIGYGSECLVRPKEAERGYRGRVNKRGDGENRKSAPAKKTESRKAQNQSKKQPTTRGKSNSYPKSEVKKPFERKKGWAKPKKKR